MPNTPVMRLTALLLVVLSVQPAAAALVTATSDFSRAEPGEALAGGAATSRKPVSADAYSHSSANLSFEDELQFKIGNGFFKRKWVSAPSSTEAADGIGPLFNARACQQCHIKDGRGHPPAANWPQDNAVSMILKLSVPPLTDDDVAALRAHLVNSIPDPVYGGQLQDFAVQGIRAEGHVHIDHEPLTRPLSDGAAVQLLKPVYTITDPGYGDFHARLVTSPRVAPPMIGLGLLELVEQADIASRADPDDADGDGISGHLNLVYSRDQGRVMPGRFGWKAGQVTLNDQNQTAFSNDLGISTPLHPEGFGECSAAQTACRSAPDGASPQYDNLEAHGEVTDLVLFYARNLAVPVRRNAGDAAVLSGKKVFYESGCIACHTPKYRTGKAPDRPHLSGQLIWPYTDLLLHDMGDDLADGFDEGQAGGREWRTPPLWGIGLTATVSGHTRFLHDGRARSLLEAVLWHGGEAEPARRRVQNLSDADRQALLTFLESL